MIGFCGYLLEISIPLLYNVVSYTIYTLFFQEYTVLEELMQTFLLVAALVFILWDALMGFRRGLFPALVRLGFIALCFVGAPFPFSRRNPLALP